MKILLYGINFSPELTGIGKYSGEMAAWLAMKGHEIEVITAPPYYPDWKVHRGFTSLRFSRHWENGLFALRCPLYIPSRPTALRRMLHLASFSLSSMLPVLARTLWRPDVVILVAPTLLCAPQTLLLAKLSGARSVLHIQDYEVDALFGLGLAKGRTLQRLALGGERFLLKAFDLVSSISFPMLQRAREKGVREDRLRFFPNWSEIERFQNATRSEELLASLGVDPSKRVVLYSGNIGEKQGLEIVIEAAAQLSERLDMVFLIVGEGAGKTRLATLAQQYGLSNVIFAPLQPYEALPSLLASADCHLVVQKRGAADAVLPSKLTNILAIGGNAVITADPETSLGMLCRDHPGIAVCVSPESVMALLGGIEEALAMPGCNEVASRYAKDHLDKDTVLSRFLTEL